MTNRVIDAFSLTSFIYYANLNWLVWPNVCIGNLFINMNIFAVNNFCILWRIFKKDLQCRSFIYTGKCERMTLQHIVPKAYHIDALPVLRYTEVATIEHFGKH